jgi:DNA-3-methyladenine glycosylase II
VTRAAGRTLTKATLRDAVDILARRDPLLATLASRWGVPPLWARPQGFATLVRIILEQQVSLASAATLYRRLETHAGAMTPPAIARLGVQGLRDFGLTRQKAAYVHGLAERVASGILDLRAVARAADTDARAMLLAVPGLGPWSVDIYQLMALRHPDVWPQGDLALAITLRELLGLPANPSRETQREIAARWTPWRSVAARLVWAEYLGVRGKLG